ncbi:MAG: PEGA domain-containing protein [Acidobacteriota bacterium]
MPSTLFDSLSPFPSEDPPESGAGTAGGDSPQAARRRIVDVLTALEKRIGALELARDAPLAGDDRLAALGQLTEEIMRRAADFQVQKKLIDDGLADAGRVVSLLNSLDARVAALTAHAQVLAQAEDSLGRLERRAMEATADLQRRLDEFDGRKRTLEQALDDAERLSQLWATLDARAATGPSRPLPQPAGAAGQTSGRARKAGRPAAHWLVVVGVLAALVVIGLVLVDPTRIVRRASGPPAAAAVLPGRTLGIPTSALPASRPAGAFTESLASVAPSSARPTNDNARTSSAAPIRSTPPPVRSSDTAGREADTGPARNAVQPFIGDLTVESVPTGAAVFIDQREAGRTPLQVRRLRAGSHVIRIEHDGYERWTTTALVPADQQTRVTARLQRN